MKPILIMSRQQEVLRFFRDCLRSEYGVDQANDRASAMEMLRKKRYEFIFMDLAILSESVHRNGSYERYKEALKSFWLMYPTIEIIVMASDEMIRDAVMAVKAGASNYLTFPLNPEEVRYVIESTYESRLMQSELDYLRDRFWESESLEIVKTRSPAMKTLYNNIRSVAPTRSTVLLIGETGTGKGVLARLIHRHSNRKDAQFIGVHCGAIPDTLIESELFGHEKGAFTGAVRRRLGKFEIATGGTIFLDEIGTITPAAQIKLLQVLQDGTIHRVGGEEVLETNARVIAATNTDLKRMCDEGRFRKDLYYRLNVFPIEIPPLRERREDIPFLIEAFLARLNKLNAKEIHDVHPEAMEAFNRYSWPGNIRELENLVERAYILETSSVLTPQSFPQELFESTSRPRYLPSSSSGTLAEVRRKGIEEIERRYLKELLCRNKGKINISAKEAGISTRQLHKLMVKYGIRKEDFKYLHGLALSAN